MKQNLPAGYRIRQCIHESDAEDLHQFVVELADFAGKRDSVETTPETICKDALNTANPFFFAAFVEHYDNTWIPVGFVVWYYSYSTWVGRTAYLEDLYVREPYRQKGLGTALFHFCVEKALSSECKRIEWVVLKWNDRAKNMYLSMGAAYPGGGVWDLMRMDVHAMQKLVTSTSTCT